MKKLINKLKDRKNSLNYMKKKLKEDYNDVLNNHKDDLIDFKVAIYQKFKNEYLTKDDKILKIDFEYNVEKYPGGYKNIVIYNKLGYRLMSCEKFIIDYKCNIDKELSKTFQGIQSKFSAKQIITSSLNGENPIINYYITREDFKKSVDSIIEKEEKINSSYSISKKLSYTFK